MTVDRSYMLSLLRGNSMGLSALDLNDQIVHSSMTPWESTLGRSNDPEGLVDSHSVLDEGRHSDPTVTASMKGLANRTPTSYPKESSNSRRVVKDAVHRWLQKGARSPRRRNPTNRQEETPGSVNRSSSSAGSSTQKAASHSLPSVVSSLEVFKLGARRRRASPA